MSHNRFFLSFPSCIVEGRVEGQRKFWIKVEVMNLVTVMRTMAMNVMNKVNNIMNNCNGDENSGEINGIILKNIHCLTEFLGIKFLFTNKNNNNRYSLSH